MSRMLEWMKESWKRKPKFPSPIVRDLDDPCNTNADVFYDAIKGATVRFVETTPLTRVDGSINPKWLKQLAIGFPTLDEEQLGTLLESLRKEQDALLDLAIAKQPFPEETLFDQMVKAIRPEVSYDPVSEEYRLKMHGQWYTWLPGLSS